MDIETRLNELRRDPDVLLIKDGSDGVIGYFKKMTLRERVSSTSVSPMKYGNLSHTDNSFIANSKYYEETV